MGAAMVTLGAAVLITVAGPVGSAAAATDSDSITGPGGSGTITCTTQYDLSASGASVHPVKTTCKNNTTKTIHWDGGHYSYTNVNGSAGYNLNNSVYMNPGGTYTYYFGSSAPWCKRSYAEVENFFRYGTGYDRVVTNRF
jgi:hypothetical protein